MFQTSGWDEQSDGLDTYLPVGVLWKNQDPKVPYPEAEISLLEEHRWARSQVHNGGNLVRVYIDHRMTSRGNTQRSITKLRAALKTVMAKIDNSPHAWHGFHVDNPLDGSKPESVEDESLWYIFNTLKNPCPQVEKMSDFWSRQAMEELLSEDTVADLHLKTNLYPYQRRSAATMIQREVQPARMLDPRLLACKSPTGREYYYDKEDAYITLDKVLYSEACGGKSLPELWLAHILNGTKQVFSQRPWAVVRHLSVLPSYVPLLVTFRRSQSSTSQRRRSQISFREGRKQALLWTWQPQLPSDTTNRGGLSFAGFTNVRIGTTGGA